MPKYVANIEAKVDLTDLENLKKEIKTLESTPIKLKLDANGLNLNNLVNQINSQFSKAGASAGNNLGNNIASSVQKATAKVKSVTATNLTQLKEQFKNFNIDTSIVDNFEKSLKAAKITVNDLSASIKNNGKNSTVSLTVSGVDELGNAVKAVQSFNNSAKKGLIKSSELQINQSDVSGVKAQAEAATKAYEKLKIAAKECADAQVSLTKSGLNFGEDSIDYKNKAQNLKNLTTTYENLKSQFSSGGLVSDSQINDLDKLASAQQRVMDVMTEYASKSAKAAQIKADATFSKDQTAAYQRMASILKEIGKLSEKRLTLDPDINSEAFENAGKRIDYLVKEYNTLYSQFGGNKKLDLKLFSADESARAGFDAIKAKINDIRAEAEKSITLKINDDNWSETFSGLKGEITELKAKGSESVSALSDELKQLKATRDSLKDKTGDELISGFEKYEEQLQSLQTHIKTAKNELKGLASAASISRTSSSFETWLSKNTKALDHYGDEIDKVRQKLMEFKDVGATTAELNSVKTAIDNIKSTAAAEGNVGVSWIGKLGDQFKKLSTYVSAASVIYTGIRALKSMYSAVSDIDTQMTELKKVTDETDATYSQFLDGAKSKAVELGVTVSDLVSATADFARLGYSMQEATNLAQVATIYANVGKTLPNNTVMYCK